MDFHDHVVWFSIDPGNIAASGFSAGGMMVWTLACHRSDRFVGFVPMSGVFWAPTPATCTSPPAPVIHVHGTTDKTVPLAGRKVLDARQGVVRDVIGMYATYGSYGAPRAQAYGGLSCEERRNPNGVRLDLCLFDGGHSFGLKRLEAALARLYFGAKADGRRITRR